MKILLIVFGLLVASAFGAGHCKPDETTYFSCVVKGSEKTISVCGGTDWLQYRFGKLGSIELAFPKDRAGSLNQFNGADRLYGGSGVSTKWLMFERSGIEYSVTQMEGGSNFNGVTVLLTGAKKAVDLPCDRKKPSVRKLYDAIPFVPEGNP